MSVSLRSAAELLRRDIHARTREAVVTMLAVLASFGSALALKRAEGLTPSVEVLAVALTLTLSRVSARPDHQGWRGRLLGLMVLPVVAVGASEIGTLLFRHPDLGDLLFVLGVSGTVWMRRFSDRVRRLATFIVLPLISVLIVPGVAVVGGGGGSFADRLWSALVAVIALGWVTVTRSLGRAVPGRSGGVDRAARSAGAGREPVAPARAAPRVRREGESRWRMAGTTKLAIQMAVSLAAGFVLGRWLFSPHWSWCVLSAFIVSSANRGREDVLHKAAMRLLGAGVGTLGATLISGAFAPGDAVAIVVIFIVLGVAVWLRPLNYAFWAAGMTAALALLYGYYGEGGVTMLGSRLEGICLGAALAVVAAWLLWPIRTADIIRRDVGAALAALDRLLVAVLEAPEEIDPRALGFRRAVAALEYHRTLLLAIPRPLRRRIDHLPAVDALWRVSVPSSDADPAAVTRLRAQIRRLRRANAEAELPDAAAWNALVNEVDALEPPVSSSSPL